jgi:arylsulfatase A-like enzyme
VAFLLGFASGLLELAVLEIQLHFRHSVDWYSLMVSRHITWMVPVTAPLLIVAVGVVLVAPALAKPAWRRRKGRQTAGWAVTLAWAWAGTLLGALLFIGPLLAIRALHTGAAAALALGLGFRLWHWLVRPITGWHRLCYFWAGIAILTVPVCLLRHKDALRPTKAAARSRSVAGAANLLWVVVDTLRADHMSLYGYTRCTTPNLEAWANVGIMFELAYSAAPWTLPSHVTMFTGLWPYEHGAQVDRTYSGLSPTLAEHLRAHGYQTGGFVANVRMCNAAYGVGRGFEEYVDYPCNREITLKAMMENSALGSQLMKLGRSLSLPLPAPTPFGLKLPAQQITAEASVWLDGVYRRGASESDEKRRPFFLFMNFMDVHGPYLPSEGAPRRFWTGPIPPKSLASPRDGWRALRDCATAPPGQQTERQRELENVGRRLSDLYDECLSGLDAELGRFLAELRAAGRLANTWVVITADHGEHFGEHDRFGHGSSLYNEQTHVPLILIPPLGPDVAGTAGVAQLRGRRVAAPVSLRDLPRTLTELLVPGVDNPFPGRGLAHCWNGTQPVSIDPVLSQAEQPRLVGDDFAADQASRVNSVIAEDYILIESATAAPELYALDDRKQQRNLAGETAQQARVQRLQSTLATLRGGAGPH